MNELRINVIFEGATTAPKRLRDLFTTLCSLEPFIPNFWGPFERKRFPFDIEEIASFVAKNKTLYGNFLVSSVDLWRTRAPRYEGYVLASDRSVNTINLVFSPAPAAKYLRSIYEAAQQLVDSVPTVFAYVHPAWIPSADLDKASATELYRFNWGSSITGVDLHERGLDSICARTWFGPMLVERIGRARLLGIEGATEQSRGGIRIDLVPEPWSASFEDLRRQKEKAMEQLEPSGMFVEATDTTVQPAPKWVSPDWVMKLKRKEKE